jgi:hypothetical protein
MHRIDVPSASFGFVSCRSHRRFAMVELDSEARVELLLGHFAEWLHERDSAVLTSTSQLPNRSIAADTRSSKSDRRLAERAVCVDLCRKVGELSLRAVTYWGCGA